MTFARSDALKSNSTNQIVHALKPPRLSLCTRLSGTGLNPHLIQQDDGKRLFLKATRQPNGFSSIAANHFLQHTTQGVSQSWILYFPVLFISDPSLMQQLAVNNSNLFDGETGGVQEKFFGKNTIISLPRTHPHYKFQRMQIMHQVFTNISNLAQPMHIALNPYFNELKESKEPIDLYHFSARVALANISTALGFDKESFPEEDKLKIIDVVHEIVTNIPNPTTTILIDLENKLRHILPKADLLPHLNKLLKEGEDTIKSIIKRRPANLLIKMRELLAKPNLNFEDLDTPNVLSWIKLFLIGGFETTTKLLLFSMLMLGEAKNKEFVELIRNEIMNLGKPVQELEKNDLDKLPCLHAFIFEILRLYPPFSHMRHTAENSFSLAQNIGLSKTKEECKGKMSAPTRDTSLDVHVPKGTRLISSPYDAHRNKTLYGENAGEFNPKRWLEKSFSLRDVMHRLDFFTFGNDARACPGRIFSEQEAMLFIARLIAQFDIKHNLLEPYPLDIGFTLEIKHGVSVLGTFAPCKKATEVCSAASLSKLSL